MHRRTSMTHEESGRGWREGNRVGRESETGRQRGREGCRWRWMCCERTDDRTDGVHKARRAKLDREQKEREGEDGGREGRERACGSRVGGYKGARAKG